MRRLRNAVTGVVVNVDEATAGRLSAEWSDADAAEAADAGDYSKLDVKALRKVIAERNEGRDPEDVIDGSGKKAELVAALIEDDEAKDDADGDESTSEDDDADAAEAADAGDEN